jgi:hypothetical protein
MLVVAPDGALERSRISAIFQISSARATRWSSTTRKLSPRGCPALECAMAMAAHIEATLIKRVDESDGGLWCGPPRNLDRRAHSLRRDAKKGPACCAARSTPRSRRRAKRRGFARLRLRRRGARRSDRARGRHAVAALYRGAPQARRRRPPDYQTVFAAESGAVAAPTAGLHFTPELVARVRARWRKLAQGDAACRRRHISAGEGDETQDHVMHAEWGRVDAPTPPR